MISFREIFGTACLLAGIFLVGVSPADPSAGKLDIVTIAGPALPAYYVPADAPREVYVVPRKSGGTVTYEIWYWTDGVGGPELADVSGRFASVTRTEAKSPYDIYIQTWRDENRAVLNLPSGFRILNKAPGR